jgi:quercetin dioxygenase-like cupin family protein
MKRRSLLKSAAALLPTAGLQELVFAQAAAASSAEVHVVGAGQDRFGEHHSPGFSTICFKVGTGDTGGGVFIIEHEHLVRGGPPLHLHFNQDEWFYVMEGQVDFQVGSERKRLGPGESVLAPRRIPHTFSAAGNIPAHMMIAITPAGMMEQFFRDIAVPNGPKMDAAVFSRYEMRYVGPSAFAS